MQFLEERLKQLQTAVMYTMSNNVARLPNGLVFFEEVDNGQLFLSVHNPKQEKENYEQCFPVRLFFYRKGVDFFIEVTGTATIVVDKDILLNKDAMNQEMILLKMTPTVVEYTEKGKKKMFPELTKLGSYFYNGFRNLIPGKQFRAA